MIHEEEDYDLSKIPEDEPVFLVRGKDPAALEIIRTWLHVHKADITRGKRLSLMMHATKMERYAKSFK